MTLTALATMAAKGLPALLERLSTTYAMRAIDASPSVLSALKKTIEPHVRDTYARCSQIKTLLNPLSPANFLSIYATQRFRRDHETVDQYDIIDYIKSDANNVIITGTGGSGKSMFTRYLWLALFLDCDGRIPLFLELRSMNSGSKVDLIDYLYYSVVSGSASISESNFRKRLLSGDFILILDGFDELNKDRSSDVQLSIMQFCQTHRHTKVIVTSRPLEDVASWTTFHVVEMAALELDDVFELVSKAEFEPDSKSRFLAKLTSGNFFSEYRSFLANPLLASIMLLVFSQNFEIPNAVHLFYQQAFEALYRRHDSYKPGGFKREFNTKLNEDEFKRLFSVFCLLSYQKEAFDFDKDGIIAHINRAASISNIQINPDFFLNDLIMCVCLIVPDGNRYKFTHRSFQEFFTAYCISNVVRSRLTELIVSLSSRRSDETIPILSRLNPGLFRKEYVLPISQMYSTALQLGRRKKSTLEFLRHSTLRLAVNRFNLPPGQESYLCQVLSEGAICNFFFTVLDSLMPDDERISRSIEIFRLECNATRRLFNALSLADGEEIDFIFIEADKDGLLYSTYSKSANTAEIRKITISNNRKDIDDLFLKTRMNRMVLGWLKSIDRFISESRNAELTVELEIDSLFQ